MRLIKIFLLVAGALVVSVADVSGAGSVEGVV